jgi:DNA-binding NtrC family response regulator
MAEKKKVLIIEDEEDLAMLLRDYFVRRSYEVSITGTLSEGAGLVQATEPDVLFIDNNLPDGAGWASAPAWAAHHPGAMMVLVSAYRQEPPQMPPAANYHIIEKPIRMADLDKLFPSGN